MTTSLGDFIGAGISSSGISSSCGDCESLCSDVFKGDVYLPSSQMATGGPGAGHSSAGSRVDVKGLACLSVLASARVGLSLGGTCLHSVVWYPGCSGFL